MRGMVFLGNKKTEIKEFPDLVPGPGEVVINIKTSGLCGSDLHTYYAEYTDPNRIMGHEGAGIVTRIGEGVTNVKEGDRVAIYHFITCGMCRYCMSGYGQFCPDKKGLGGAADGTHAEQILVKAENCLPLPDDISFAVGAFIGCFAGTSYSAMKKLQPNGLTTLAVFGLGPVGMAGVQYAKAMGARVIGIDHIPERLNLAKELGADDVINFAEQDTVKALLEMTDGKGPELIYESSGSPQAQKNAIESAAVQGKVCLVGYNGPMSLKTDSIPNLYIAIGKELTIMGSSVMPRHHHYEIIDFIRRKNIDLEKMVTHRFPFDRIDKAFEVFDTGKTGKVIVEM
ncbi:MAG: alcohol dehydrogenase catalytic domain-containing protein [Clostridiales bacterium]|nr:alcohol dehydrogenase catalytic domain-containing protein [Clostridiales bacterium]